MTKHGQILLFHSNRIRLFSYVLWPWYLWLFSRNRIVTQSFSWRFLNIFSDKLYLFHIYSLKLGQKKIKSTQKLTPVISLVWLNCNFQSKYFTCNFFVLHFLADSNIRRHFSVPRRRERSLHLGSTQTFTCTRR